MWLWGWGRLDAQEASDVDQVGERTELVEGSSDMDDAT